MNRSDLEFFYRTITPKPLDEIRINILKEDFSSVFNEKDKKIIENFWKEKILKINPKSFSKPNGLATLFDTSNGNYSFKTTEFKDYVAVSRTSKKRNLTLQAYERMRVAAVGAYLITSDGSIFVHKRSKKATHAPDLYDSSCAGLCILERGEISLERLIYEKIQRELGLGKNEFILRGLVGIHSSKGSDYSGMFDISLETNLNSKELTKRIRDKPFENYRFVKREKLANFIIKHCGAMMDMAGDGAGTLCGALNEEEFIYVIEKLKKLGKRINFGRLEEGEFVND